MRLRNSASIILLFVAAMLAIACGTSKNTTGTIAGTTSSAADSAPFAASPAFRLVGLGAETAG